MPGGRLRAPSPRRVPRQGSVPVPTLGIEGQDGLREDEGAKKERDESKEEAQVARLATVTVGDVRAKLEGDLARVKDALAAIEETRAVAKEARCKVKSEAARIEVDRTSLLLELGTTKDEVSSLQS